MFYGIRILLLIMMLVAVAEADIYKYEDDSGVTYYTDFPLNKKAERIMRTSESKKEDIKRDTNSGIDEIVNEKAKRYDLHPSLVHAVIKAESNGNPRAVSRKGAMGLMQLMPSTANDLRVRNPFDPEENIDGGVRYLRYLIDRFNGDLTLALAAYNAGPKTVEKTKDVPRIPETKEYVKKVMSMYKGDNPGARVSSKNPAEASPKPAPIYKIVQEDGTILFTNSPVYKKNPRL